MSAHLPDIALRARDARDSAALREMVRGYRGNTLAQVCLATHARSRALDHDSISELLWADPAAAVTLLANPALRGHDVDLVAALVGFTGNPKEALPLLPLVHRLHPDAYQILEQYTREQVRTAGEDAHDLALLLLTAAPILERETLHAILTTYARTADLMIALTLHPSAGAEHWEAVARGPVHGGSAEEALLRAMLATPARRIPALRERVLASGEGRLIENLASDADAGEFRHAARVLCDVAPRLALSLLQEAEPPRVAALQRSDLLPLLQHEDRPIREGAQAILSRLRSGEA